ncbi:hypothetical protein ACEPAI_3291 [Sanghuangporus weigelae]
MLPGTVASYYRFFNTFMVPWLGIRGSRMGPFIFIFVQAGSLPPHFLLGRLHLRPGGLATRPRFRYKPGSSPRAAQPSEIRNIIREISELLASAEDAASPSSQDATDCGRHPNEDDFLECALGFLTYLHDHPNRRRRGGCSHQGVPDLTHSSYGSSSGRSGPSTGPPLVHPRSAPSSSDPDSRSTHSSSSAGGQAGAPQTTITELFRVRRGHAVSPLSPRSGGSGYQGGISDHSAPVSPVSLSPPPSTWSGNRSRVPSPEEHRPSRARRDNKPPGAVIGQASPLLSIVRLVLRRDNKTKKVRSSGYIFKPPRSHTILR